MRATLHATPFSGMLAIVVKLEKEIPPSGKELNRKREGHREVVLLCG